MTVQWWLSSKASVITEIWNKLILSAYMYKENISVTWDVGIIFNQKNATYVALCQMNFEI